MKRSGWSDGWMMTAETKIKRAPHQQNQRGDQIVRRTLDGLETDFPPQPLDTLVLLEAMLQHEDHQP